MKNIFSHIRYYLEIIALPSFIYLVIHLSGHGALRLFELEQDEYVVLKEFLLGVPFAIYFIRIWHKSMFKKWIPCAHEYCNHQQKASHIFAIGALTLHFFSEATIRDMFLADITIFDWEMFAGIIGFGAHFLVDIIITVMLSSYWKTFIQKGMSFCFIALMWGTAFWFGSSMPFISESMNGLFFILSAFVLALFVHKPHKPKI